MLKKLLIVFVLTIGFFQGATAVVAAGNHLFFTRSEISDFTKKPVLLYFVSNVIQGGEAAEEIFTEDSEYSDLDVEEMDNQGLPDEMG